MESVSQSFADMRRKFPRVPLATMVELESPGFIAYGQTENVSVGGMLIRCECVFAPGTPLLISFALPGSERMQIQSHVVHCRPGVRVGVQFDALQEATKKLLSDFTQPVISVARRSERIPFRFIVELRWMQANQMAQAMAETVLVSRHGCLVLTDAEVDVDTSVALVWPDLARATQARVVSRRDCAGDSPRVALEFVALNDFWQAYSGPRTTAGAQA